MAFPTNPVNGQKYDDGTYIWQYKSMPPGWVKIGQSTLKVTANSNTSSNTTITTSNVSLSNTSSNTSVTITPSNVSLSNTSSNTSVTVTPSNVSLSNTSSNTSTTVTPSNVSLSNTSSNTSVTVTPSNVSLSNTSSNTSVTVTPSNVSLSNTTSNTSTTVTSTNVTIANTSSNTSTTVTSSNVSLSNTSSNTSVTVTPSNVSLSNTSSNTSTTVTSSNVSLSNTSSNTSVTVTPSNVSLSNTTSNTSVTVTSSNVTISSNIGNTSITPSAITVSGNIYANSIFAYDVTVSNTIFLPGNVSGTSYTDGDSGESYLGINSADTHGINLLSDLFVQIQYAADVANANAYNSANVNWLYVDSDGIHITANVTGSNSTWDFNNNGSLIASGNITASGLKISNVTYPTSDGTIGQVITTDGNGNLTFATVSASSAAAGGTGQIQFNTSGALDANAGLTYDSANYILQTGVVRGILFEQITDYGNINVTADIGYDYGLISNINITKGSYEYIVSTVGEVAESYTVSTLPNAQIPGQMIFVSDESGGPTMAFSDGSSWRRIQDRAVVS